MASWFSAASASFSGSVLGDKLNGLKDQVQSKVKNIDPDLIKKLTLQSDELVSERQRIDKEERRKETVRDSLAEILPWETRDAEMEILVDECKEVIFGLSSKDDTFIGPFVLAGGLPSGVGDVDGDDEEEDEEDEDLKAAKDLAAAEVSAEKLSKLQPLPTLLADFDLDTHVGLIQRLLKVDPKLVEVHSRLSSGGQRELIFWKNYFFHCAYTRYEAGLSIDEIWSNEPRSSRPKAVGEESEDPDLANTDPDEEVVFDSASIESGSIKRGDSLSEVDGTVAIDGQPSHAPATQASRPVGESVSTSSSPQGDTDSAKDAVAPSGSAIESGGGTDYEFVATVGGDGEDGSMDELEAEIAAALGD
mmetsp:Transcript_34131/g.72723  ORF Transcript_34131/g.72723 Transcript_34131/m.72723 type:complete len:362 (+) Transcript_34131:112-1197(+)|eukprot:CAMPEP_0172554758 /NCGR_PEP_ID=MMETSP1067-20121228/56341_1 /TAXON_ID=265564 ORGANISM="Thalassiosira punctigera, Strain Tpunct2005C2" /NCGR_SAMPLE_ID=MMETSP1067 /ASSEMBLY_ACC=CAM_ASM_000444 /LENGTH=361 /DNA_ID=CAMNT_0013343195 /DNA_START=110 /DNA_END=1195 /DNA_ORIENTATION=+